MVKKNKFKRETVKTKLETSSKNGYFKNILSCYINSFKKTSFINLFSIVTDFLMIIATSLIYIVYYILFQKASSDLTKILQGIGVNQTTSTFWLQFQVGFQFIGTLILAYFLFVLIYSALNYVFWSKSFNNRMTFWGIFDFVKLNFIFTFVFLFLIYFIRWLVKDPFWAHIDLLLIILFFMMLPIMHIFYSGKKYVGLAKIIFSSLAFIFVKIRFLLLPYFMLVVTSLIMLYVSFIFKIFPRGVELFLTLMLGLFIISWMRMFMIEIVGYLDERK